MRLANLLAMARLLPVLQVSKDLYRSPQPEFEDLLRLKAKGIRSLVNLRVEAVESEFYARQAGLAYLHVAVEDWTLPTLEQVKEFVDFMSDDNHRPALIHCAAGVGRTGTFVACYRISQGMSPEDAIRLSNSESPLQGVTMNRIQQEFVRKYVSG